MHNGTPTNNNKKGLGQIARTAFATVVSVGMVGIFALPAYSGLTAPAEEPESYARQAPQQLKTIPSQEIGLIFKSLKTTENVELVKLEKEEKKRKAEEQREAEAEAAAEAERVATEQAQAASNNASNNASTSGGSGGGSSSVPASMTGEGLLGAALSQLGTAQDCTALLERGLGAMGYSTGDLGTGIWEYDRFGTRVSLDSLQPGDILIYGNQGSGAHVAVYAGNGQAVHGGMWDRGGTILDNMHNTWEPLTGAVRPR